MTRAAAVARKLAEHEALPVLQPITTRIRPLNAELWETVADEQRAKSHAALASIAGRE